MVLSMDKNIFTVKRVESMSSEALNRAVQLTTKAFDGDPIFDFIFRGPQELSQLIDVSIRYYLKCGLVFGAFDENGNMQGISMWTAPNGKPITASSVVKSGMLGRYFHLLTHIYPASFYRMMKMSDLTQIYHPKTEHWYLYLITAFKSGAGGALLNDADKRFEGGYFYLENSNPAKNNRFYEKHGFKKLPQISWHGCTALPMKKEKGDNIMCDKNKELTDEQLGEVSGGMLTSSCIDETACEYCDGSVNCYTGYCKKCGKVASGGTYVK